MEEREEIAGWSKFWSESSVNITSTAWSFLSETIASRGEKVPRGQRKSHNLQASSLSLSPISLSPSSSALRMEMEEVERAQHHTSVLYYQPTNPKPFFLSVCVCVCVAHSLAGALFFTFFRACNAWGSRHIFTQTYR